MLRSQRDKIIDLDRTINVGITQNGDSFRCIRMQKSQEFERIGKIGTTETKPNFSNSKRLAHKSDLSLLTKAEKIVVKFVRKK